MHRVLLIVSLLALTSGCGERIADERGTITRCPVHNVDLLERVVPISYGYPERPYQEEMDAAERFPRASRGYMFGGCIVSDTSPQKARVRHCPKCDEAAGAWRLEFTRQVLNPLVDYMVRVQDALSAEGFKYITTHISRRDVTTVLFDGQVASAEELARLKHLAENAKPPRPVVWQVRVSPK